MKKKIRVFQLIAARNYWQGYVGEAKVINIKPNSGDCIMPDAKRGVEGGFPFDLSLNNGKTVTMAALEFIDAAEKI